MTLKIHLKHTDYSQTTKTNISHSSSIFVFHNYSQITPRCPFLWPDGKWRLQIFTKTFNWTPIVFFLCRHITIGIDIAIIILQEVFQYVAPRQISIFDKGIEILLSFTTWLLHMEMMSLCYKLNLMMKNAYLLAVPVVTWS